MTTANSFAKQKGRAIEGLLLLDKPKDITSNGILQKVKKLFFAKKAGHTGSLDPIATGLLPICFGNATKYSMFLLEADKRYRVVAKLGVTTATGDTEGEIIETKPVQFYDEIQIDSVLQSFAGEIEQVPPMYSAIKHEGRPLYHYARKGVEIDRKARKITIFEIKLINIEREDLEFEVHCTKGTYVRTLVEEIGQKLGCGAHVSELRRLDVGLFKHTEQISYADLLDIHESEGYQALDKFLLPVDSMLRNLPSLAITEAIFNFVKQGKSVQVPTVLESKYVKLTVNNRFQAVGEVVEDGRGQLIKLA